MKIRLAGCCIYQRPPKDVYDDFSRVVETPRNAPKAIAKVPRARITMKRFWVFKGKDLVLLKGAAHALSLGLLPNQYVYFDYYRSERKGSRRGHRGSIRSFASIIVFDDGGKRLGPDVTRRWH